MKQQKPSGLFACLLAALLVQSVLFASGNADSQALLTSIARVRALSREEAGKSLPVRVQGVLTWSSPIDGGRVKFVLSDGEKGVWVDQSKAADSGIWKDGELNPEDFKEGSVLEIHGITDPGGYATMICPSSIRRLGVGPLPEAQRVPMERLISGAEDCSRIVLEGVIQEVKAQNDTMHTLAMVLMVGDRPIQIWANGKAMPDAAKLIDAQVRVTGVCTALSNARHEMIGLRLSVMNPGAIETLVPPPANPFLAPKVRVNQLLHFSPDVSPFHRKVTQGVVTFAADGSFFFLQDQSTGVLVESPNANVQVGEHVEIAGFVNTRYKIATLTGPLVRKLGPAPMPTAAPIGTPQIFSSTPQGRQSDPISGDFNNRLVRISGILLAIDRDTTDGGTKLSIESEGYVFSAHLQKDRNGTHTAATQWSPGAKLELTGVCQIDYSENLSTWPVFSVASFRFWLRSPGDVRVLHPAPWWTPWRMALTLLGSGTVLLLALGWIYALRRTLVHRTGQLEELMRTHRDVELEYTSARRERLRLALDLHDGLRQLLSAVSFRMDAAAGHLPGSPDAASAQIDAARSALDRTQTELQECLWGLHAASEGPPDLVHLLIHVTERSEVWPIEAVSIKAEGSARELPRHIVGSLLRLFQEAVGNAFKHGAATRIDVAVRYGDRAFEMLIVDDGRGFDPANAPGARNGHFGLDGMRQRVRWLHGSLNVHRRQHGGMELLIRIPWSAIPDLPPQHPEPDQSSPPLQSNEK